MKRLAMVAAASFLAMLLTGCGEGSKPEAPKTDAGAQQTQDNGAAATQNTENNAGAEQKPAEGQTQGN
jgi:PBP1b-binding outer membrane lipoprotein LpoB